MSSRHLLVLVAFATAFAAGVIVGQRSPPRRASRDTAPVPEVMVVGEPLPDGGRRLIRLRVVQVRVPGDSDSDPVAHLGEPPPPSAWSVLVGGVSYFGEVVTVTASRPE